MKSMYKVDNWLYFSKDKEHDDRIFMSDKNAVYQLYSTGKIIQKYKVPMIKKILGEGYCIDDNYRIQDLWDDGIHCTFIYNYLDYIGPLKNTRYEDASADMFFIDIENLYHFTICNEGEIEVKEIKGPRFEGKWTADLGEEEIYYNLYLSYDEEEDEEEEIDSQILYEYADTLVVYNPNDQKKSQTIFSEEELTALYESVKYNDLDYSHRFRDSQFLSGCCYSIIGNQIICLDLSKKEVDVIYQGERVSEFLVGNNYLIIYTFDSSIITVDMKTKSTINKFSIPKEYSYVNNLIWINWHNVVINTRKGLFIYDIKEKTVKNMSYLFEKDATTSHFTNYDSNLAGMEIIKDYTGGELPFA